MFKIRGHFITQEPYFNNLVSLTFSTECGDLEIMVPNDAYQQYFTADGTEPQMESYWSLLLFQKNFPDLGGTMMFRFATAEKIADAPSAPVSETPETTKAVVETPMAEDTKSTTDSEQPEPEIVEPASDTEKDNDESASKPHLADEGFMKDFMDEAETETESEAKVITPAEAPDEIEGEVKSANVQDNPSIEERVEPDNDGVTEASESEKDDQAQNSTDQAEQDTAEPVSDTEKDTVEPVAQIEEADQPIKLEHVEVTPIATHDDQVEDYDPSEWIDDAEDDDDEDDDFADSDSDVDFNWDFEEKPADQNANAVEAKTVGTGDDVAEQFAEHEAEKTAEEQANGKTNPADLAGDWTEDDDEWSEENNSDDDDDKSDDSIW